MYRRDSLIQQNSKESYLFPIGLYRQVVPPFLHSSLRPSVQVCLDYSDILLICLSPSSVRVGLFNPRLILLNILQKLFFNILFAALNFNFSIYSVASQHHSFISWFLHLAYTLLHLYCLSQLYLYFLFFCSLISFTVPFSFGVIVYKSIKITVVR